MDRTEKKSVITVKKLDMNSPDFYEENMALTEGTPKECWDVFWAFLSFSSGFIVHREDYAKPLQRNVVRKTCWTEIMREEKNAWAQ